MKKMSRTDRYTAELRDPALAALLRETYADDPALTEAPGRTERIMRQVQAAQRPASTPWVIWGWASGAVAATVAMGLLALSLLGKPAPELATVTPPPVSAPVPAPMQATPLPLTPRVVARIPEPTPTPHITTPAPVPAPRPPVTVAHAPMPAAPAASTTTVAAALYTAGAAAHEVGDYEGAYEAYQASYETEPNPETLLAASEALLKMDGDDAQPEG
jgi:hypothetical protein